MVVAAVQQPPFVYLSLGAGVQSTTVLAMSCLGLNGCPRAEVAIFADTQDEPGWVYDHLAKLEALSTIPIRRVTIGCLSQHVMERQAGVRARFAAIPAWTMGADGRAAPLRRQCTREYKIRPIETEVRRLCGAGYRKRMKKQAVCMIGISLDEADRMRESRTKWVTNSYPLIDARLTRERCIQLLQKVGWPVPRKSSCVFCPYHSDAFWSDMKANHPDEFGKAVVFDQAIRNMSMSGIHRPVFLHRSLQPLASIDFDRGKTRDMFTNDCSGHCGV